MIKGKEKDITSKGKDRKGKWEERSVSKSSQVKEREGKVSGRKEKG